MIALPLPGIPRVLGVLFLLAGCVAARPAVANWQWLPGETLFPRALADPRDPAASLLLDSGGDRIDAALGMPLPLLAGNFASTRVATILEVGSFFVLRREGSFFPLETFDGLFGLGFEARRGPWHARLRAIHVSAHKADGDSSIAYPGITYSREDLDLEAGLQWRDWFAYLRAGMPWHAVPRDEGPHLALGTTWTPRSTGSAPFGAIHLSGDAERNWRIGKSVLLGFATGRNTRFRVAFRYYNGYSPEGQYRLRREDQWGMFVRFGP